VPASRIFTTDAAGALQAAPVLLAFLVCLVPLAVLFVIQRTFYAYDDTRTPFLFTLVQVALVVTGALVSGAFVDADVIALPQLASSVALTQSLASVVQVILATWLLQRRLGGLRVGEWMLSLGRFVLAALPAAAAGWGVYLLLGGPVGWTTSNPLLAAVGTGIIGLGVLVVYVGMLAVLRAPELHGAFGLVRRFLPGGR